MHLNTLQYSRAIERVIDLGSVVSDSVAWDKITAYLEGICIEYEGTLHRPSLRKKTQVIPLTRPRSSSSLRNESPEDALTSPRNNMRPTNFVQSVFFVVIDQIS